MRRNHVLALAALVGLLTSACAHERPDPHPKPPPSCNYRVLPIAVGEAPDVGAAPPTAAAAPSGPTPTLANDLAGVLMTAPPQSTPTPSTPAPPGEAHNREILVLSGGSQHGAFGGGFFSALPNVPTYDVVTGVSTGALQSTLVFLANQPMPTDREYPKDQGERRFKERRSNLEDLAVALSISGEPTLLKVTRPPAYGAIVNGSTGTLEPLRTRLLGFASEGTLQLIKAEAAKGRKLYVGVSDLDDGQGYAIDLTELSSRLGDAAKSPNDAKTLRECYVAALVASSSVPVAAQPVTLDIQPVGQPPRRDLFIDGGARFGVFLRQLGDDIRALQAAETAAAARESRAPREFEPTNVTVIVNGKLYGKPWREKGQRPEKYSLLTMGLRSVDLLTNQVYRFSVDDAEHYPRNGGELHMAFISNQNLRVLTEPPGAHRYGYGGAPPRTCDDWSDEDERVGKPLEFHARYMACLVDYGRARATQDPWNKCEDGSGVERRDAQGRCLH
jgi:predicted acylesterase/phospholipase RssA